MLFRSHRFHIRYRKRFRRILHCHLLRFVFCTCNVYGTYVHGIFDEGTLAETLVGILAARKGVALDTGQMISYGQFKQMQYDKLADGVRKSMDMEAVYAMLREAAI